MKHTFKKQSSHFILSERLCIGFVLSVREQIMSLSSLCILVSRYCVKVKSKGSLLIYKYSATYLKLFWVNFILTIQRLLCVHRLIDRKSLFKAALKSKFFKAAVSAAVLLLTTALQPWPQVAVVIEKGKSADVSLLRMICCCCCL